MDKKTVFTVDWEPWFCFKPYGEFWENHDPLVQEPTLYLLDLLKRHNIKAIFYCLGWLEDKEPAYLNLIRNEGHTIGYHSFIHQHDPGDVPPDRPYRGPRWRGQKRLYSGGFWFRVMPYGLVKREVLKTGTFFIHPYDVMLNHPLCDNPIKNFERNLGLKTSRDKLEKLTREIEWMNAENVTR